MLGVGLALAIPRLRTVCYVERDAYAAAALVARMEDETLDRAPLWADLLTFDGSAWRGAVDIISAGFPCQPWSAAGKRRGTNDDRWLWPGIADIVRDVAPRVVFLENVPGLVRGGLELVLADLAHLGYDAAWSTLRASSVGATHQRDRVFIVANAQGSRCLRERLPIRSRGQVQATPDSSWSGSTVPPQLGYADGQRCDQNGSQQPPRNGQSASVEHGLPIFAPGPDDQAWTAILAEHPEVEPAVCRTTHGLASRVDRLRVCGNGVVPLQVAVAYRLLADRLGGVA